jgi:hypothetical protein
MHCYSAVSKKIYIAYKADNFSQPKGRPETLHSNHIITENVPFGASSVQTWLYSSKDPTFYTLYSTKQLNFKPDDQGCISDPSTLHKLRH